jgi:3'(2'),5'-bisphosphate nucleotidase
MDMNPFLSIAREAALTAGKVITEIRNSHDLRIQFKEDNSPVTQADLAAQEVIISTIRRYVNHQIRSEELPSTEGIFLGKDSPETWIVDPIDGTEEFISGGKYFSISIAYTHHGKVLVGVIYAPALEQLYYATRGEGAFLNDQRIQVSSKQTLKGARQLLTPEQFQRKFYQKILQVLETKPVLSKASTSLKAALIASGEVDIYLKRGPTHEWDIAAGDLLIWEAGGVVTDLSGLPILYTDKNPDHILGLCAGNKILHGAALKTLRTQDLI